MLVAGSNSWVISSWKLDEKDSAVSERKDLFKQGHNVPHLSFSPCGQFLAAAGIDKKTRILEVDSQRLVAYFQTTSFVWTNNWVIKPPENSGKSSKGTTTPKSLGDYLLITTSNNGVFLLDLLDVSKAQEAPARLTPIYKDKIDLICFSSVTRLSISKFCPELQMFFAVSHQFGSIHGYKIIKMGQSFTMCYIEISDKEINPSNPILGFDVIGLSFEDPTIKEALLYVLTYNKELHCLSVSLGA